MNEVNAIKSKRDFNAIKRALHGRNRLLLTLGTAFGLRVSDLLMLKVGQLTGDSLTLTESKRSKTRTITFSKSVKAELKLLDGLPADSYVFASRKGNAPITRVQAYRILNDAVERAGLTTKLGRIGTHSLRKTFGYRLYENGVDITRIMTILSHSSERETLKYIGVTADEIADAYESIEI
ncbi:tyrosine-type recombinase/integrase [Fictibacillus nanhaiensis]|uniref:tyrosine-type recombinase/integrase n=1 Tax=Fictibacillus nanhaiensis TaxID=742169 RepID=UPI002040A9F2|nr:tyrosine-type recombinase/integrase [Fictibacillus nanhaiensis]MCM3732730.1 tyrosine-type recombinase/integrase [Fictibacillus nanhaiensis]